MRVLIIDDTYASRLRMAIHIITLKQVRTNIEFDEAATGEEALSKAKEAFIQNKPFDVYLMDIDLGPGLKGTTVSTELRKLESATKKAKILCISSSKHLYAEQKPNPMDAYLGKDFKLDVLSMAIYGENTLLPTSAEAKAAVAAEVTAYTEKQALTITISPPAVSVSSSPMASPTLMVHHLQPPPSQLLFSSVPQEKLQSITTATTPPPLALTIDSSPSLNERRLFLAMLCGTPPPPETDSQESSPMNHSQTAPNSPGK